MRDRVVVPKDFFDLRVRLRKNLNIESVNVITGSTEYIQEVFNKNKQILVMTAETFAVLPEQYAKIINQVLKDYAKENDDEQDDDDKDDTDDLSVDDCLKEMVIGFLKGKAKK